MTRQKVVIENGYSLVSKTAPCTAEYRDMRKALYLITFTVTFLVGQRVHAGPFGLGVVIGAPIGIAANYHLGRNNSIDGVLSPDFGDHGGIYVHSTYLWHYPAILHIDHLPFGGFWGIGARFRVQDKKEDEVRFGPRLSGGMLYQVKSAPVDIFLEVAIVVDLVEKTGLAANLGLGARYYF